MKNYEDNKISFSYPDELKLVRAKEKWGQYNLEKKRELLIIIQVLSDDISSEKRLIQGCVFDEFNIGEHYELVFLGDRQGIGHVVTLYDLSHKFIQKRYRYLFPTSIGGLYIEFIGFKEFLVDTYKEIMESIRVKEKAYRDSTKEYDNNIANSKNYEDKLQYFSKLGKSLEKIEPIVEYIPSKNKGIKLQQEKTLKEFHKKEKEILDKVIASIYQYYRKIYPIYKKSMTTCYQIYNKDIKEINRMLLELLPEIKQGNELHDKIALSSIRVYESNVIGLEFICSWDEEHGLGVLLKNFEVKDVGLGEISYCEDGT